MAKPTEDKVCILKVTALKSGRKPPSRTIAILGKSTLYTLASTILRAFNFDSDHLFGFYDNVDDWTDSDERYEFDGDFDSGAETDLYKKMRDVRHARISRIFNRVGKEMLFLYDYGDEWQFVMELLEKRVREEGKKYPAVIEREEKAPRQYGGDEEERRGDREEDEYQYVLDRFYRKSSHKKVKIESAKQQSLDKFL